MVMNRRPTNQRPLKRRRRLAAESFDFFAFPAAGDAISGAPFRMAVRCFLSRYATPAFPVNSVVPALVTWQLLCRGGGGDGDDGGVVVYVVEEDVTRSRRSVYCDQCRVVGWSGHPVCQKRYHIIIPGEKKNATKYPLPGQEQEEHTPIVCKACGHLLHLSGFMRCQSCNFVNMEDNVEEWLYPQLDEDPTHLLHGVIHSNGYGHLITLNGREGGSLKFTGRDILNFWDRLCQALAVRKISVMDVSKRYGVEYRLLHAISYGCSWYGKWGYEFGSGSYGGTLDAYKSVITHLSSMSLSLFTYQGRRPKSLLQELIELYQSISYSKLETLRDLFSFILHLIHKSHSTLSLKLGEKEKVEFSSTTSLCHWSIDDVKRVEEAMIKVLLATTSGDECWVSRCALKGALFRTASPELLDYCLKNLEGKQASNGLVVNSRCNNKKGIEFRLEPVGSVMSGAQLVTSQPSEEQLINDLRYIYDCIFRPRMTTTSYLSQPNREMITNSVTKLLDCKHFVKDYNPDQPVVPTPYSIYIWCHVEFPDHSKDDPTPPPELLILPENVSVADTKLEASKAFQEVYVMFKRFEAEEMLDYGSLGDSMTLKLLVGLRGAIRVRGRFHGIHGLGRFRMERGLDNWVVDCTCGAKDDDGEKMLACDECETWQHTRCAGIDDHEEIPTEYLCTRCFNPDQEEPDMDGQSFIWTDNIKPSKKIRTCRSVLKGIGKGRRQKSILDPAFGVH